MLYLCLFPLKSPSKIGSDRSSAPKTLSFGEKIAKIGPADPEIICLLEIMKKILKRKKLTQAKYIALPASLPSGLKKKLEMRSKA